MWGGGAPPGPVTHLVAHILTPHPPRFLKRWRPKQWGVVGNVGPLVLMVMFCGVVYGYGEHGGLLKRRTCQRVPV